MYSLVRAVLRTARSNFRLAARMYYDESGQGNPEDYYMTSAGVAEMHSQSYQEQLDKYIQESAKNAERLKVLELEVDVMRHSGYFVPEKVKPQDWYELLQLDTVNKRKRYLEYRAKVAVKKQNRGKQQREKLPPLQPLQPGELRYNLMCNSLLLRIYDKKIMDFYNSRLVTAMQFSQKLVFDCSFHSIMNTMESSACAKQLLLSFSMNRMHDEPFDLHFCGINRNSKMFMLLHRSLPTMYNPEFPMNLTEESYLDKFDRNKLVYLTPHCKDLMQKFDHDAVYIIGAYVDKTLKQPLTLAKAKKEGLRMLRLPLEKYVQWGVGANKSLTLNQVLGILLDLRKTGDWNVALKHLPSRKLYHNRLNYLRNKVTMENQVLQDSSYEMTFNNLQRFKDYNT